MVFTTRAQTEAQSPHPGGCHRDDSWLGLGVTGPEIRFPRSWPSPSRRRSVSLLTAPWVGRPHLDRARGSTSDRHIGAKGLRTEVYGIRSGTSGSSSRRVVKVRVPVDELFAVAAHQREPKRRVELTELLQSGGAKGPRNIAQSALDQ